MGTTAAPREIEAAVSPFVAKYFSQRAGRSTVPTMDLNQLRLHFKKKMGELGLGWLQAAFGYDCVDQDGYSHGDAGVRLEDQLNLDFGSDRAGGLNPFGRHVDGWDLDDVLDMIEFLYDYLAEPGHQWYHDFANCGLHVTEGDYESARRKWREYWNPLLAVHAPPMRMTDAGKIELMADDAALQELMDDEEPTGEPTLDDKITKAVAKFKDRHSDEGERRQAVRELADVLEKLRSTVLATHVPNKDEARLFEIANEFAIRHFNNKQKTEYSGETYLPWIFHCYLATIHLCGRILTREKS